MSKPEIKVADYINRELWDTAKWRQTIWLVTEDLDRPPGIGLRFENMGPARKIFHGWRESFGGMPDREDRLRVVIIEGRNREGVEGFTLGIGPDTAPPAGQPLPTSPGYTVGSVRWRFQGADAPREALQGFRSSYERFHTYFVVPLPMSATGSIEPDFSLAIAKGRVYFRTFDEVAAGGAQDEDSVLTT